jgi:tetratricopeptide (TPR) repeat protein
MSIRALGVVAGAIVLGGIAMTFIGGPVETAARVAPPAAVASAMPASSTDPGVRTVPNQQAIDPGAASMDISRAGLAAYNRGDVAGSIEQFTTAVEADPGNADALNNLGQALVRAQRTREAIPFFDRAVAASGSTWAYHFNRARAHAELKQWGQAVGGYRDAARLFPGDYVTAFNLAKSLQASGDLPGAIAEFDRAIALAPGEADFHLSKAYALETAKRPRDAAAAYRQYLELEESAPQAEKIKARIAQIESQQIESQ